jgi:2-polyprenyl-3-methyl-5-hydroxy-6-metoxy-1,4-benzoquinol methylase
MLQLKKFYEKHYGEFLKSVQWQNGDATIFTQNLFSKFDETREQLAKKNPRYFIDDLVWTVENELIDDPHFVFSQKQKILYGLHLKNLCCGTYTKALHLLSPHIRQINQVERRPARILELASGLGQLTFGLYDAALDFGMDIEITGSDIVEDYIENANDYAFERQIPVTFKIIDAFHLDKLEAGSYDIIFTLHSLHHFLPEQLSQIMRGADKVATRAFIGIDGYRGISNLFFMMSSGFVASLINLNPAFFHDSLISGRRLFSCKQLEIIAKLSCPHSQVNALNLSLGLTMIEILHHSN